MSTYIDKAFNSASDLNMWFKIRYGEDFKLSDIPELIPYRWDYFKKEWNIINRRYVSEIPKYGNPDTLRNDIDKMTGFINSQNNLKISKNPFLNNDILFMFYSVFDVTSIKSIPISKIEQDIVDSKIARIRTFIRKDFIEIRKNVIAARDYMSDVIGTGDEEYNNIYGRSKVDQQLNVTNKNLNLLLFLQDLILSVDFILANIFSLETVSVDPFALAKANAKNVDIGIYSSGSLVRFNYGESLQDISKRELGDSDKWIDLAIANGLKPPYIDEIGEKVLLLSNASGNQINIPETSGSELNIDKLFVNQVIFIKSNINPMPSQRIIKNIRQAPVSGEIIIEVDGDSDLDKYKISDNAHIRIFKPNTINSSFLILIPSPTAITNDSKQDTPWFLRSSSESEKRQKIDLMISDNGDLAFNSSEDLQLSFGLENAIQALKIKMSIERGEIQKHPGFGLPSVQGLSTSDVKSIESFLVDTINDIISKDPRFDRVESLSVVFFNEKNNVPCNGFDVKINVRLAGSESTVPIAFSVNI